MEAEHDTEIEEARRRLIDHYPGSQVREAVDYAIAAHQGQRRRSGEPFVLHPLSVAEILADQGLSAETVTAAVLHDVVEDSGKPVEEIAERFGEEIALLVDGLTKIVRIAPRGTPRRQKLGSYRKLLLAAAQDARVLVIKLADRLHNMRTADSLPPVRQEAIAHETLEIYAPLAHRLGMGRIREELEDLCLRILDPRGYEEAGMLQAEYAASAEQLLAEAIRSLNEQLRASGIDAQLKARLKSRFSISEKVKRRDATDIWDILGLRILVEDVDFCYRALGIVHATYPPLPSRIKDFIGLPKANLYQSIHTTVLLPGGKPLECQIRTRWMDELAEYGVCAHWHYKSTLRQGGPESTRAFIAAAAEEQAGTSTVEEAFAALKADVFADEIYVFTPRGEPRVLPAGACAIDFAYAIHTDLGHRCVGARIDGQLKSLTRPLQNGEVVEIIAGREASPSRDWLKSVRTSRARSRIRSFHQAEIEREQVDRGLRRISQALRQAGLAPLAAADRLTETLSVAGFQTPDQAALEAVKDESRLRMIIHKVTRSLARPADPHPEAEEPSPTGARALGRPKPFVAGGVVVDGVEGVSVRMAGCCSPEPGDAIVGYISLARGVAVHRADCRNVISYRVQRSARLIDVRWAEEAPESFISEVEIVFTDRPRLLAELDDAVAEAGAEFSELRLKSDGRVVRGSALCTVSSAEQSERLRRILSGLPGALRVRRARNS